MILSRSIIISSFVISLTSFALYLCPCEPFILQPEQANELFLALFGAGISALFVSLIEYHHHKDALEAQIYEQFDPLLSLVAGLGSFQVELLSSSTSGKRSFELLVAYFDERSANQTFDALNSPPSFNARNSIMRLMGYSEDEFRNASDEKSSNFNRYIERSERQIRHFASSYTRCADAFNLASRELRRSIEKIRYLPSWERFFRPKEHQKAELLNSLLKVSDDFKSDLADVFEECRLFCRGESDYASTLTALANFSAIVRNYPLGHSSNQKIDSENHYADRMYQLASSYADAINRLPDMPQKWW